MSLPNYVERRAEILAELFLRELNPKFLAQASFQGAVWDYIVAFENKNKKLINIAVEIKGTEESIQNEYIFNAKVNQFLNSNLPILILIVDVKSNSLAWNWGAKAKIIKDPTVKGNALIRLPVIKNSKDSAKQLLKEIESL